MTLHHTDPTDDGVLDPYRNRAVMLFGFAIAPLVIPFALLNLYRGGYLQGFMALLLSLIMLANSLRAKRREPLAVTQEHFYLAVLVTTAVGFQKMGVLMVFWCYPLPLYFLFAVNRALSNLVAVSWWLFVSAHSFLYLQVELALRVSATLLGVILLGQTYVSIIDRLKADLIKQATTDPLTGLLNRQLLAERLTICLERIRRGQETASLCLLDLDHFKQVNDQFGHQQGDQVLRSVASLVRSRARKIDQVFRYGGEEILVVLSAASLIDGLIVAEDLRRLLEKECRLPDGQGMTASFGVAEVRGDMSVESWLKQADEALYRAKSKGRNRVEPATMMVPPPLPV